MSVELRFVDLDGATPDEVVVVIDVLRAFTTVPALFDRAVTRVLAVDTRERAIALRDEQVPDALLAGEIGGAPIEGFDLGNSPTAVAASGLSLEGATVVQRTTAGTQGLVRCATSDAMFAASFVTAATTAEAVRRLEPRRVTFVVTGASLGRDGDEDLAAAELIGARVRGEDPDPAPFLARIATSDAGATFVPGPPEWAPPEDLAAASEVDRSRFAVRATARPDLDDAVVELRPSRHADPAS